MPRINTFASWKGLLFAGIKGLGVQISYDTGATWADFNSGLYNIRFITDLLVVVTLLYAGTDGAGVWVFPLGEHVSTLVRHTTKGFSNYSKPVWHAVIEVNGHYSYVPGFGYDLQGRRLSQKAASVSRARFYKAQCK